MSRPRHARRSEEAAERPLRADARRNRERVVAVARKLFEQRGVAVEMDEIARRAGVGVGTIYRHFPTKESLIQGVAASYIERLLDAARDREDAADAGAAFFEYLAIVAHEFAAKHSLGHAMTQASVPSTTTAAGSRLRDEFQAAFDLLLTRAKRAAAVRGDVTAADVMVLIKSTLSIADDGSDGAAATRARLFQIVCAGLRP